MATKKKPVVHKGNLVGWAGCNVCGIVGTNTGRWRDVTCKRCLAKRPKPKPKAR